MIEKLPPEILLNIISKVSYKDVSVLRFVSKTLHNYCDEPIIWRSISLESTNNSGNSLWKLSELRKIIDPHLPLIQSIRIWGVRDNVVQYLLSSCHSLQHLTICGWTTLSDHCLRLLPSQPLELKTLELIGTQETNFVSVDAYTISNLLIQSPHMTSLVLGCENQIHAETFVTELERKSQLPSFGSDLQLFSLASRRTWLHMHILRLLRLYPAIQKIYLVPRLTEGFVVGQEDFSSWIDRKMNSIAQLNLERIDQFPLYITNDMVIYDKNITVYAS